MSSNQPLELALMYSDIEGSARLAAHLGDLYASVLDKHNKIFRSLLQLHKGQVIGHGIDNEGNQEIFKIPWSEISILKIRKFSYFGTFLFFSFICIMGIFIDVLINGIDIFPDDGDGWEYNTNF